MLRLFMGLPLLLLAACTSTGQGVDPTPGYSGRMPVDFSGSWERDYSRGEDVQGALNRALHERNREIQARRQMQNAPRAIGQPSGLSKREVDSLVAVARLVEEITRPDVLTISQNEHEVRIARKDDFAMSCSFYDGIAQGTASAYGTEVCSWEGDDLVSHLIIPGLQVTHRFTISPDGEQMRVITTATSGKTREPIRLLRYYLKFDAPPSAFNCIETLSMKRVCSTGDTTP